MIFLPLFHTAFPHIGGLVESDGLIEEGLDFGFIGGLRVVRIFLNRFQDDVDTVFDIADFLEVADEKAAFVIGGQGILSIEAAFVIKVQQAEEGRQDVQLADRRVYPLGFD